MLVYLKRYFWAVSLGFITSASTMAASAVNRVIGSRLEPAPLMPTESNVGGRIGAPVLASIDVEPFAHLFGIAPPPPPPDTSPNIGGPGMQGGGGPGRKPGFAGNNRPVPKGPICMDCEPVKSGFRVQLLATMVANDHHWSMALVSDLESQKTAYFMEGDRIKDCVVYDVRREPEMRVVIINEEANRLEYIDGTPGTGGPTTTGLAGLGTAPVPPPGEKENPADGIRQLKKGKYQISKDKLDSALANLNELATQARIVPNFKNGTSNGFKLFSIQPGSLYSAIGIQNGDVITQINGLDINSPEKALEIYTRLKDASNIKVAYERNGQSMSSDYTIQ